MSYEKRITIDSQRIKELYPNISIDRQNDLIKITDGMLRCVITLPKNYPFTEPVVFVNYKNHSYNQSLPDWSATMDFRTIFNQVLVNLQDQDDKSNLIDIMTLRSEKGFSSYKLNHNVLNKVREHYPDITIKHDNHHILVKFNNIEMYIEPFKVSITEGDREWGPIAYDIDIINMIKEVIDIHNRPDDLSIKTLTVSLETYFDNVVYNDDHQTFMIQCSQAVIIIGISLRSHILPTITTYCQGMIVNKEYHLLNWQNDFGKVIYDGIHKK